MDAIGLEPKTNVLHLAQLALHTEIK